MPEEQGPALTQAPEDQSGPQRLSMRTPGTPEPIEDAQEEIKEGIAGGSEAPALAGGLLARKGTGFRDQEAREAARNQSDTAGGGGGGAPAVPNLRPTPDIIERAVGGGSVDHLDGVEEGEVTALNSKEWKYASFFNRLKREVAQNWDPNRVLSVRDPTGRKFGVRDRITTVQVTLDANGALAGVLVLDGSGVDALDEEAVRAIRAAQPFPNPPPGLVDARSRLISFPFNFHVMNGDRGRWRIFRGR